MKAFLTTTLVATLALACGKDTKVDVCSAYLGRFVGGEHYVQSDFLTEDKNWDYKIWNKNRRKRSRYEPNYICIPIEKPKTATELIDDEEEVIDLMR